MSATFWKTRQEVHPYAGRNWPIPHIGAIRRAGDSGKDGNVRPAAPKVPEAIESPRARLVEEGIDPHR